MRVTHYKVYFTVSRSMYERETIMPKGDKYFGLKKSWRHPETTNDRIIL